MIVACETCACLLGVSGGMPPPPPGKFMSSQIASDAIRDKISKQHFDDTSDEKKKSLVAWPF